MNTENKKGITSAHVISFAALCLTIWGIFLNLKTNQLIGDTSEVLGTIEKDLAITTRMSTVTWVTANLNREAWISYLEGAKEEAIPSPYIMLDGGIERPDKKGRDLLEKEFLGRNIKDKVIELKSAGIPCDSYRVIRRLGVLPLYNKFIAIEREEYPDLSMDTLMVLIDSYVRKIRHHIEKGKITIPKNDGKQEDK